jgi:ABC-type Na+ efflux pump permease subunit
MWASLCTEWTKFSRRWGTYLGFGLLLALSGLLVWGAYEEGKHTEQMAKRELQSNLGDDFIIAGKVVSAVMVPRLILEAKLPVYVFVACIVAMTAGGGIATEYSSGTLRTLLTRPVRRAYIVAAKWLVNGAHAFVLTMFLGLAGLGLGYIVLGGGDLVWVMQGLQIVPEHEALRGLAIAYALQGLAMVAVASIALLVSAGVSRGATAAGVTVSFMLISGMVGALPLEAFKYVRPYLLTTQMARFEHVLDTHPNWTEIHGAMVWVVGYAIVALVGAIIILGRREIRC